MNRKALLIGIDKYIRNPLFCCVNDVKELKKSLEFNEDGHRNFDIIEIFDEQCTRANLRKSIKSLFSGEGEVALLYFSGHGIDDKDDGYIVTYDYEKDDYGIPMNEILKYAKQSNFAYKVIILDCCHSGFTGHYGVIGDTSILSDGVIIMTASRKDESAVEVNGHGVFTNLLIESLNGGASDILGNVTPGSVYAYIDQALGAWSQRPLFKANISSFVSLRKCKEKISINELREVLSLFNNDIDEYKLDPSYEKTNIKGGEHKNLPPYANQEHVKIFTELQKCNRNGLIIQKESPDMYFAAMDSKSCILTPLGKHYWKMMNNKII